mmetsp:Transcript_62572/g.116370  ORF Transcript_62572/g.116370 Transcript_62572/m.116370 type:complete len:590 (+) Transcript_62572:97-1866(+)
MRAADDDDGKEYVYRLWPSRSKFLCGGLAMTGPCPCLLAIPWVIVGLPVALYCRGIAPGALLWHPYVVFPALASFAAMLYSLYRVTCTDPGVLPRRAFVLASSPGSPSSVEELQKVLGYNILGQCEPQRDPDIDPKAMVSADMHKSGYRWCQTCEIVRPPRSSHCSWCDHCVLLYDHHCPFLNVCIARRNYKYFLWFSASIILSVFTGIGSAVTWLTAMEGTRVHYRVRHRRRKKLRGSNFDPLPAAAAVVQSLEERAKQSIGGGIQPYSQATANDIATTLLSSDTTTILGQSRGLSALGSNDTALDNAVLSAEEFSLRLTGMSLREATVTISIVAGGLSLFGATLLAYHCYLLRLGKTTKEHWTEGRQNKSKVDLLDTSTVLDIQGSTLTGLAAPLAKQVAAPQEQRADQAKAERNGLVDRKAIANQAAAPAEPVPVPTQKYARSSVPARIPMRARRRNRELDNCSTLCGNTGPRLLDPYDRVSKQVVAASLEAARSARDKYIRHRMQLLQERYHYPRELALRRSIRDMDGTNCALCEGTCVEKACKEGIASLSRRLTIQLGFLCRAMRALSRCDARAMFRKEKAMEV